MPDVYEKHRQAFAKVEAFAVLKQGDLVATVAFRHPSGHSLRLVAFVHWLGTRMSRGFAGGGGYDKHSAAVADAIAKSLEEPLGDGEWADLHTFRTTLQVDDGKHWDNRLRDVGFDVRQII